MPSDSFKETDSTLDEITDPLRVIAFGPGGLNPNDEQMLIALSQADLVVALGGVNLQLLASFLPPGKPALCVLSGADLPGQPPEPFRGLHGRGVALHGWRISGVSGSPLSAVKGGYVVEESAMERALEAMPGCEVLLSATPPSGYEEEIGDLPSYQSLRDWIDDYLPYYVLFGHPLIDVIGTDETTGTLFVGVNRWLVLPPFLP